MDEIHDNYGYCIIGEATDVGRRRKANEDSCAHAVTINGLVATVCDGMGGHVGGATASRIAVETLLKVLDSRYFDDPREAIGVAIDSANSAILDHVASHPELSGMGSTCVLLLVRDGKVYAGHVGDSRIYIVRNHRITRLTKDHSYVQMLVDAGQITAQEAECHPRKNEITNALGLATMQPATIIPTPITPEVGDCFLLCSDGLTGMVPEDRIERVISRHRDMRLQQRADTLIDIANDAGGVDNISVELVEFADVPAEKPNITRSFRKPALIAGTIAAIAVSAACGYLLLRSDEPDNQETENTELAAEANASRTDTTTTGTGASAISISDNAEERDLGTVLYTNSVLTVRSDSNQLSYTYTDGKKHSQTVIQHGFAMQPSLDNCTLSDSRLSANITKQGDVTVFTVAYKGRKAPRTGQGFAVTLSGKDGHKICLKFQLKPDTGTPPAKPETTSPAPPTAPVVDKASPKEEADESKAPQAEQPETTDTHDDQPQLNPA